VLPSVRRQPPVSSLATCPAPVVDMHGWQEFAIQSAPISIKMPPAVGLEVGRFDYESWRASHSLVLVVVADDSGPAPLRLNADGPPAPLRRANVSECTEVVAGRTMRVRTYRETSGQVDGEFVAEAYWPLTPGSWLKIGTMSESAEAQSTMIAAFRTLRVDTTDADLRRYHARAGCGGHDVAPQAWPAVTLHY